MDKEQKERIIEFFDEELSELTVDLQNEIEILKEEAKELNECSEKWNDQDCGKAIISTKEVDDGVNSRVLRIEFPFAVTLDIHHRFQLLIEEILKENSF